jgi:hypothetical protein
MTVFIYVNTSKHVGDADHLKVFATVDAAEKWFEENDPEGVAFEYEVDPVISRDDPIITYPCPVAGSVGGKALSIARWARPIAWLRLKPVPARVRFSSS